MQVYSSFTPQQQKSYYKKSPFYKGKFFYIILALVLAVIAFIWWSIKQPPEQTNQLTDLTEPAENTPAQQLAKITYIKGSLQAQVDSNWQDLTENNTLAAGSTIKTLTDSRAIITFPDGSLLRMDADSEIILAEFGQADIIIEQKQGQTYHRVNEQSTAIYRVRNDKTELTALGTGFNAAVNGGKTELLVIEGRVKIKLYEDDELTNILNMRTIEQANLAKIDPALAADQIINLKPQTPADLLNDEWHAWNKEQDEAQSFFLGMFEKSIELKILQPDTTELELDQPELTIKGQTAPEAEVYIMGKAIENKNGEFSTKLTLPPGENIIEIVVQKDQNKNKKVIYATVKNSAAGEIILNGQAEKDTANLTWEFKPGENNELSAEQAMFRVVQSTKPLPIYPDNTYHSIAARGRTDSWAELADGEYYFRVCLYSNQQCSVYSNQLALKINNPDDEDTEPADNNGQINLTADLIFENIMLKWDITGGQDFDDIKLVINTSPDPSFPQNSVHSLSKNARSDLWKGLSPGIYHFRVCLTKNGECFVYSNNASLEIPEPKNQSGSAQGSIFLSGKSVNGAVNLSWSTEDLQADKGFRILSAKTANPTFPGAQFLLETSPTANSITWPGLESGTTYYFTVCANTGTSCGVYSNEISVIVE